LFFNTPSEELTRCFFLFCCCDEDDDDEEEGVLLSVFEVFTSFGDEVAGDAFRLRDSVGVFF